MRWEAGCWSLLVWAHLLLPDLSLFAITADRAIPSHSYETQLILLADRSIFLTASPGPFNSLLGMGSHKILRLLQLLVILLIIELKGVIYTSNA